MKPSLSRARVDKLYLCFCGRTFVAVVDSTLIDADHIGIYVNLLQFYYRILVANYTLPT